MNIIISSKSKAIQLRKQGKSYNEINKILGIPKSTLSTWLKEVPFSEEVKKDNIQKAKTVWANNISRYNKFKAIKYRKEYRKLLDNYAKEIPVISKNSLFWLGLALFWAEGSKREKWSVRFVNSDKDVIKAIMRFYREICEVHNEKFRLRVYLHPNIQDACAKNYWAKITKIPINQFYRSQEVLSKASSKKRFNNLPYGTLHIYINDSSLSKKMKGWIKGITLKI